MILNECRFVGDLIQLQKEVLAERFGLLPEAIEAIEVCLRERGLNLETRLTLTAQSTLSLCNNWPAEQFLDKSQVAYPKLLWGVADNGSLFVGGVRIGSIIFHTYGCRICNHQSWRVAGSDEDVCPTCLRPSRGESKCSNPYPSTPASERVYQGSALPGE